MENLSNSSYCQPSKSAAEFKNYRPTALTSILCKVMERIVYGRIMTKLLKRKKTNFCHMAYKNTACYRWSILLSLPINKDSLQTKPHKKNPQ